MEKYLNIVEKQLTKFHKNGIIKSSRGKEVSKMEIDKQDLEWLISLLVPIMWEIYKGRKPKKKTPNPKPPRKKKRS